MHIWILNTYWLNFHFALPTSFSITADDSSSLDITIFVKIIINLNISSKRWGKSKSKEILFVGQIISLAAKVSNKTKLFYQTKPSIFLHLLRQHPWKIKKIDCWEKNILEQTRTW